MGSNKEQFVVLYGRGIRHHSEPQQENGKCLKELMTESDTISFPSVGNFKINCSQWPTYGVLKISHVAIFLCLPQRRVQACL